MNYGSVKLNPSNFLNFYNLFIEKLNSDSGIEQILESAVFLLEKSIPAKVRIFVRPDHTEKSFFVDNRGFCSNKTIESKDTELFSLFSENKEKFLLNGILADIQCLNENFKNGDAIAIPLQGKYKVFGYISLFFEKDFFEPEFLASVSRLIAFSIRNKLDFADISEKIRYYRSSEIILKVLHTQYELEKVIPVVGEAIDRFVEDNLIYIFSFENGNYKLEWPNSYPKERIDKVLSQIDTSKAYVEEDFSCAILPLRANGNVIGTVVIDGRISPLKENEIEYLEKLCQQASSTLESALSYTNALKEATTDVLTGIANRREFDRVLKTKINVANRKKQDLCCFMADIDYFKKINDTYGHKAGDIALKEVSRVIKTTIRDYDIAARYGGEEFCVILPHASLEEALSVAERVREEIMKTTISIETIDMERKEISATASFGVTCYRQNETAEEFLMRADKALYEAKELGRNRVCVG